MSWTRLVENIVLPPAGLIWLGLAGLVLVARRRRRWGLRCLAASVLGLWLLSTPLAGRLLLMTLDRHPPLPPVGELPEADCVVILGAGVRSDARELGGDTVSGLALERLSYGSFLARRTGRPVLVTGYSGNEMAATLETAFGTGVRWKTGGRTTRDNAVLTAEALGPEEIRRVYLVTHFWHMPRSVATFRAAGLEPVPAPLGFAGRQEGQGGLLALLPRYGSLVIVHQALHEWVGRLWYRLRYGV